MKDATTKTCVSETKLRALIAKGTGFTGAAEAFGMSVDTFKEELEGSFSKKISRSLMSSLSKNEANHQKKRKEDSPIAVLEAEISALKAQRDEKFSEFTQKRQDCIRLDREIGADSALIIEKEAELNEILKRVEILVDEEGVFSVWRGNKEEAPRPSTENMMEAYGMAPDGFSKGDICMLAKILAIADRFSGEEYIVSYDHLSHEWLRILFPPSQLPMKGDDAIG